VLRVIGSPACVKRARFQVIPFKAVFGRSLKKKSGTAGFNPTGGEQHRNEGTNRRGLFFATRWRSRTRIAVLLGSGSRLRWDDDLMFGLTIRRLLAQLGIK